MEGACKELIVAGADVNAACQCHGSTPLMFAAKSGHIHCLHELIVSGAQLNIQNKNGNTATMHTAQTGHVSCLCELIGSGANVNMKNKDGNVIFLSRSLLSVSCLRSYRKVE